MIILEQVVNIIKQESLLDNVNTTGKVFMDGLLGYQKQYSNLVSSVRGLGTFISFNLPTTELRDKVIVKLRTKGELRVRMKEKLSFTIITRIIREDSAGLQF